MIIEKFNNIKKILDNSSYFYKKDNIYIDKRTNDYAENFGLQWNKFTLTQYDSFTGLPLTKERLLENSEWDINEIKDKLIIEVGSGAGRFTEIFLSANSYIVSVEMSDAIYANSKHNNSEKIKITSYKEIGGPKGKEPTRYGDWEKNGRCSDF